MRLRISISRYSVFILVCVFFIAGCNLFTTMHSDGKESNSHVLVADGKAAMQRGDYVKAAECFRLAMEHNPKDSEARVGFAEAYLKVPDPDNPTKGFSLGEFINSLMSAINSDSSDITDMELIVPSHWGVETIAEVEQILTTLIQTLDPIALGNTEGPYQSTDVNVNLATGLFYVLRIAVQMQSLAGDFSIQMLQKSSPEVVNLNLPQSVLDQLPDEFLWVLDSSGNQPSTSFITSIQNDISTAVSRLQVAASNSTSKDMIEEIIDMFDDWETLAYQ